MVELTVTPNPVISGDAFTVSAEGLEPDVEVKIMVDGDPVVTLAPVLIGGGEARLGDNQLEAPQALGEHTVEAKAGKTVLGKTTFQVEPYPTSPLANA